MRVMTDFMKTVASTFCDHKAHTTAAIDDVPAIELNQALRRSHVVW